MSRPDFIIGGAPKCGTTSLHFIFEQFENVHIPADELGFFDADNPSIHPFYVKSVSEGLETYAPSLEAGYAADWYTRQFSNAAGKLRGEDSTTYLFSTAAAHRIKESLPDTKVVFMLRDPVARCYSQYWHDVAMGWTSCKFEKALTSRNRLVDFSIYEPHVRSWLNILGPQRVKFFLFEDLLSDRDALLKSVADFISLKLPDQLPANDWFNRTEYPKNQSLHFAANRMGLGLSKLRYANHMEEVEGKKARRHAKSYYRWFHRVRPLLPTTTNKPPMHEKTRAHLAKLFSDSNRGLPELLGRNLADIWPSFEAP